MKVFVALLMVIGSVVARGSGPYLPSGWKPDGPAFYLPSEVTKPLVKAVQEPLIEETEASGSDALREYGPPKLEVALNIDQGLPDVATEQTFLRVVNNEETVAAVQEDVKAEANTEQAAAIKEDVLTATESQEAVGRSATSDAVEQKDESAAVILEEGAVPTAATEEVVVPLSEQELVQDAVPTPINEEVASVTLLEQELSQDAVPTPAEVVVGRTAQGVNNIAEAIAQADEKAGDITTTQGVSGSVGQVPEGFLEYGPPGFLEYGPPKPVVLERVTAEALNTNALENNEVRRRRFSPKFRSLKKH